jgi:LacI family transcriptional regulator
VATIFDIARAAKCSITTVSCAINGKGRVNEQTRKRVMAVCRKLGYTANAAGRHLRLRRTETIGLMLYPSCASEFRNPFSADLIEGLENRLIAANHHLLLGGYAPQVGDRGGVPLFIGQSRVDGVVLLGKYPDAILAGLQALPVPMLVLDGDLESLPIDSVTSDGYAAGVAAVDHLVARGHRRIAMLAYQHDHYNPRLRRLGFLEGLRAHRLWGADQAVIASFTAHDDGYRLLARRLAGARPPTALLCENDTLALAMLERLRAAGVAVPATLSLIGFNDDPASAAAGLTTFRIDREALGRAAAEMVLERIADPALGVRKRRLPMTLVERSTVAGLAG